MGKEKQRNKGSKIQIENKTKDNRLKPNSISNYIKCKWPKHFL